MKRNELIHFIPCCAFLLQWIIGPLALCKKKRNNITTTILMSRPIIHCSRYAQHEMGQTIMLLHLRIIFFALPISGVSFRIHLCLFLLAIELLNITVFLPCLDTSAKLEFPGRVWPTAPYRMKSFSGYLLAT